MDRAEDKAEERRRLAELGAVEKHPAVAQRRSRGSSVLRGAVSGLAALGLHSIFDDDE